MQEENFNPDTISKIQAALYRYPILQERIIDSMYDMLVRDGYVTVSEFEDKVRSYAQETQKQEGLQNPVLEEAQPVWERRLRRVRSYLICAAFSQHFSEDIFNQIVNQAIQGRHNRKNSTLMWHNLQYSAIDTILNQAQDIELLSGEEREKLEPQLVGAKVVLIRRMISDQLPFIEIARDVFSITDLIDIHHRCIGKGQIGGKAAGIVLADRILQNSPDNEIRNATQLEDFYFIGCDEFYAFLSLNNLIPWLDQIYCSEDQMIENYSQICEEFQKAHLAAEITGSLTKIIHDLDGKPFIVRSSSMLEDGFDHPFSGLYPSYLIPNQGTEEDGLNELINAIKKVYASLFDPGALVYRAKNGLLDYPEKMAVLIQPISGRRYGSFYFPEISGAGSNISPFRWNDEENAGMPDAGYLRLSIGIGTRVTRRPGRDFSQFVILNQPQTARSVFTGEKGIFTQNEIDVVNLKTNRLECLDIRDVIDENYPCFPLIAQMYKNGLRSYFSVNSDSDKYYFEFSELLRRTSFTRMVRDIMRTISAVYKRPVFIEFSARIDNSNPASPKFIFQVNRCRITSFHEEMTRRHEMQPIDTERVLLSTSAYIQNGMIRDVHYIVYISPKGFAALSRGEKRDVVDLIGKINKKLGGERFIFLSGNRWGTVDDGYGLPVRYGDISNALALAEISGSGNGSISDPIVGTQLFQHMVEAGIYSFIVSAENEKHFIDWNFFETQPNLIESDPIIPENLKPVIKVFGTSGYNGSKSLSISLDPSSGVGSLFFC